MTHLSAVAIAFTVCLTAAYYVRNTIQSRQAWSKISTHTFDGFDDKQRYITDLKSLLRSGYAKYSRNNELFKIKNPAGGFWVVLPRSKIEEVKNASTRSFSFILAMRQALQIYFTGAPDRADWSAKVVRTDVNKNLDGIVRKTMGPVIDACFRENLPADGEAWQRVDIFDFFRNCVASITNETFVGPDLSSDVEWVEATKRFASDIWAASFSITRYSSYRRYLACFFLPSIKRLDQDKKLAERKLASRFDQRIAAQTISSSKTPDDTFQWLLDAAGPHVAFKEFTHTIVRLFMAAIFTTAQTATIALLDLLSQPEYIPELIQEIHENLQGDEIDIKSLDKLRKLDSFLKESQRMSPVALGKL